MVSAEGGTDEHHGTPLINRLRWRFGLWGLLFRLVAAVGTGHLLVLVMTQVVGEAPPREFSWSGFALAWVLMAAVASLLQRWDRRSRDRRLKRPRSEWRDEASPRLAMASSIASVCLVATCFAGYGAALEGGLKLLWADALAGVVFGLAATLDHVNERSRTPEDANGVVGGL